MSALASARLLALNSKFSTSFQGGKRGVLTSERTNLASSGQKYIVQDVSYQSTQIQVHSIVKHNVYDGCAN